MYRSSIATYLVSLLYVRTLHMQMPRTEWVLKWPGQVVIAGCQTTWTTEVSESLQNGVIADYYQTMLKQVRLIEH